MTSMTKMLNCETWLDCIDEDEGEEDDDDDDGMLIFFENCFSYINSGFPS